MRVYLGERWLSIVVLFLNGQPVFVVLGPSNTVVDLLKRIYNGDYRSGLCGFLGF